MVASGFRRLAVIAVGLPDLKNPVGITKRTSENYRYAKLGVIAAGNHRIIPGAITGVAFIRYFTCNPPTGRVPYRQYDRSREARSVERVRELRTRRGLSQTALAERAGWGKARLCDLEKGRTPNPSLRTLQEIARALDVEVYDLLVRPANENREAATLAS